MPAYTYRNAGVDIDAGNEAVRRIRGLARSTFRPEVIGDIGFFGGLFQLGSYRQPVLVSSADGVGTKLKIAIAMGKHQTVGADLVNHCVNDIFVGGAEPLFFLDYLAMGTVDPDVVEQLVAGMAGACRDAGCALIGGETAEMPDVYSADDYDLAGFIVGVVERDGIIDGSRIRPGDVLLGLPSSGLHTNGYSLVRSVFNVGKPGSRNATLTRHMDELGMTLGEALLAVHRCYAPLLRPHLAVIQGMAHITGGGLLDNTRRIMPAGLEPAVDWTAWDVPPLFRLIQTTGDVPEDDMRRTFNLGIGMVVVVRPDDAAPLLRALPEAVAIGSVTATS